MYSRLGSNEPGYWDGVDEEFEYFDILGRPRIQWTGLKSHFFERSRETRPLQDNVAYDDDELEPALTV